MAKTDTYGEAMEHFTNEERRARVVRLYYLDQGWCPCVPIGNETRARAVPHPSLSALRVIRAVEVNGRWIGRAEVLEEG